MNSIKKLSQNIILSSMNIFIKEIKGLNNLPKNKGYIITSNHASYIDPLLIIAIIFKKQGKIVHYIGKKEALNNNFFKFIYNTFDAIPIDHNTKLEKLMIEATKILKNNGIIGIFPEGARTLDGKIHSGKTGAVRFAISSNRPILPMAIKNTYILWPIHRKLPKIKRIIRINIGKPINFNHYNHKNISKKILRQITNSTMEEITRLYLNI